MWILWHVNYISVSVKVAQLCLSLCNSMNYTVQGILQARILEWVAFPFSRASSQPRDLTQVSHIAGGFFTNWATREAPWIQNPWAKNTGSAIHKLRDPEILFWPLCASVSSSVRWRESHYLLNGFCEAKGNCWASWSPLVGGGGKSSSYFLFVMISVASEIQIA